MKYSKQGRVVDEFFPQDLAGDAKGQAQASKLVRGIRLRRVLTKAGASKEECDAFLKIWTNQLPNPNTLLNLDFTRLAGALADQKPNNEELEVFVELRKKFLGY